MEWIEKILLLPFLCGAIFAVTSMIVYIFPPKKINYMYGYRTSASMKSQERWDFAQRYSTIKMFQLGLALVAISLSGLLFEPDEKLNLIIGIVLTLASCGVMLMTTENALKKRFPNE
jgi:uncharacterized membrane protein